MEFALILPLILLIVVGVFAFALIFNAQITVTNAAARTGSTVDCASLTPSDHEAAIFAPAATNKRSTGTWDSPPS